MGQQSTVRAAAGPFARRWPWAVGAAVLGAAAGGAIAKLVHHVGGVDAPDAQDPGELQAVVDRPRPAAPQTSSPDIAALRATGQETPAAKVADPIGTEPPGR